MQGRGITDPADLCSFPGAGDIWAHARPAHPAAWAVACRAEGSEEHPAPHLHQAGQGLEVLHQGPPPLSAVRICIIYIIFKI